MARTHSSCCLAPSPPRSRLLSSPGALPSPPPCFNTGSTSQPGPSFPLNPVIRMDKFMLAWSSSKSPFLTINSIYWEQAQAACVSVYSRTLATQLLLYQEWKVSPKTSLACLPASLWLCCCLASVCYLGALPWPWTVSSLKFIQFLSNCGIFQSCDGEAVFQTPDRK